MRKIEDFNSKQAEAYKILSFFGNPEKEGTNIHIVGTNGKGSTGRILALALEKLSGMSVGHFLSPHVHKYEERILINSIPIERGRLDAIEKLLLEVMKKEEGMAGYFSMSFLESMLAFSNCRYRIIEAGIGAREDITNIAPSLLQLITSIGRDHENILGPYPDGITENKADVMTEGGYAISAPQKEAVSKILIKKAKEIGSELIFAPKIKDYKIIWERDEARLNRPHMIFKYEGGPLSASYQTDLIGVQQLDNFSLALRSIEFILEKKDLFFPAGLRYAEEEIRVIIRELICKIYFTGRFEMISSNPFLIIDGAHNDPAVDLLLKNKEILSSTDIGRDKEWVLFFGMHKDKISKERRKKLFEAFKECYFIEVEGKGDEEIRSDAELRVNEAIRKYPQAIFIGAGSFYILDGLEKAIKKLVK